MGANTPPHDHTRRIVVWGRKNSINVMKVLWALDELALPFERKDVGGAFGGVDTPAYKAMNPNAKVPVLDDSGFILWESNVIVRYLAATYGQPGLFPADPGERWRAEQWMDWMQTAVIPAMLDAFWGLVRTPPEQRDAAKIEASRQACAAVFTLLDAHLASRAYVSGGDFSMGDIPVGATVYRFYALPLERPTLPHVEAYHKRLQERPGFRTHVMQPLT